jgi:hypothetical protein
MPKKHWRKAKWRMPRTVLPFPDLDPAKSEGGTDLIHACYCTSSWAIETLRMP